MTRILVCAIVLAALISVPAVHAQLRVVETPDVRLVYLENESFLVPHAVRTFLNSLAFQRRLFTFEPSTRVTVLLTDFSDTGNAGATSVPYNSVSMQIAPLSFAFETIAGNDRMNIIMNHELVHVATMDQAAGSDGAFRRLFGGKVQPVAAQPESILYFFLTAPRVAAPRWYHEGIAVFVDTWMAGGLGRAQSGWDEMVFRSMVKDGTPFYDPLGLVSEGTKIDFQVEVNSYLYGTRFMTWLARRYSPEQLVEWVSRHEGSDAYYSSQFRRVFGTPLNSAWSEWVTAERQFQQANLDAIRTRPLTSYRDLTSRALGSVSRAFYDAAKDTLYAGFNYPGVLSHVGAIAMGSGEVRKIVDVKGPVIYTVTSLAYDPAAGTLFYTTDNSAQRDLMSADAATGRTKMLLKDARIGDLAFNRADRSIWGVRQLNGICTIVRVPAPYTAWQRVASWPYGTVIYDLDVSADGARMVASFGQISGKQEVRVYGTDAVDPESAPVARFDFGASVPNNFVFSPDGRFVYGSSYYTGASNIFRYDLEEKKLDAVTNAETGFFRPVPIGGDSLIVFRYSGNGFVPARIDARPLEDVSAITFLGERVAEEHPIVKQWMLGSPAAIAFDERDAPTKPYRLAGGMGRESMYPIVQGYKDTAAFGYRLNLSDPLQLNRAAIVAAYSAGTAVPARERLHLTAEYQRFDWRARVEWNGADFYDLFGPTKAGRKGYTATVGHNTALVFDEPRRLDLNIEGTFAGQIDRLPEFQNIAVQVDRLATIEAKLSYSNVRKSLGWVDDEAGRKWTAILRGDHADGRTFPKVYGSYDLGTSLPAGHSSVWMRNAAGFSTSDPESPFANFYFGGFGNNRVDHLDEKRYRSWYSFPGVELNEIGGRNFAKSSVEWNLPPVRFRRVGVPAFYASWMRPAVFASALATNVDRSEVRRVATQTGGQLDFRFGAMSALDLTLSIGGAVALERGRPASREAMISLKVLR